MTFQQILWAIDQQILWAIDKAALHAAEAAVDAFGAKVPSAESAWDFLNEKVYGSGEVERPRALPEFMTNQFEDDYRRHCTLLLSHA